MTRLLIAALLCAMVTPVLAASWRDDAGHVVSLDRTPQRVVTLAPSLTELVFAAGAGDRIVGTVTYSDYPPAALRIPPVGDNRRLDLERVAALRPELILVWYHGSNQKELDRLSALGIPMFYIEPRKLDEIPGAIERIGAILGTSSTANVAARSFRQRLNDLHARYAGKPRVRVFYQVWAQPLLTIGAGQVISDVISLCGGENVFDTQSGTVPQLSSESVVAADPDVIIASRIDHDATAGAQRAGKDSDIASWRRFASMRAVRGDQLWTVPGDAISRAGPRIIDGAEAICSAVDAARNARSPR
ncbi:cobalamin-binding protein [Uliginosibacterium sp. sgz301328]|uniref:cobalamin-binding protein n=1 Tax=Uliginosibacterium sp. sgz301328 TaxID=3243764 RepID=UPI00359EFD2A